MVLIVAGPSLSGISDLERIIKTTETLHAKTAVCVNKADTNSAKAHKIHEFCRAKHIPFTGTIPFDPEVVRGRQQREKHCGVGLPFRPGSTKSLSKYHDHAFEEVKSRDDENPIGKRRGV